MREQIRKPIEQEYASYQEAFMSALKSDNAILSAVLHHLNQSVGKGIRPTLLLLSASLCGKANQDSYALAVALELLHTASLLHDDVVDDTYERRSRKSVNALWGNKVAILSGDFYLSKVITVASQAGNIDLIREIGLLGITLADGELIQLSESRESSINEDTYYEIIRKKTARLLSLCAKAGAMTVGASPEKVDCLAAFGEYLGLIFQIKDDIFDYVSSTELGKPIANDLREGKLTLPLIYALNHADSSIAQKYLLAIKNRDFSSEKIEEIYRFAIENGGIRYAAAQMENYRLKALSCLESFSKSPVKTAMIQLLDYTMQRSH